MASHDNDEYMVRLDHAISRLQEGDTAEAELLSDDTVDLLTQPATSTAVCRTLMAAVDGAQPAWEDFVPLYLLPKLCRAAVADPGLLDMLGTLVQMASVLCPPRDLAVILLAEWASLSERRREWSQLDPILLDAIAEACRRARPAQRERLLHDSSAVALPRFRLLLQQVLASPETSSEQPDAAAPPSLIGGLPPCEGFQQYWWQWRELPGSDKTQQKRVQVWLLDLLGGSLLTVSQQQAVQVMQQVSKEQTGRADASCVWLPYLVTMSQLLTAELWDQPCQGLDSLLDHTSEGLECSSLSIALGFAVMSAFRWSGIAQQDSQDSRQDQAEQHLLLAAKLLAQAATLQAPMLAQAALSLVEQALSHSSQSSAQDQALLGVLTQLQQLCEAPDALLRSRVQRAVPAVLQAMQVEAMLAAAATCLEQASGAVQALVLRHLSHVALQLLPGASKQVSGSAERDHTASTVSRIVGLAKAVLTHGSPPGWESLQQLPMNAEPICTALNLFRMLRLRCAGDHQANIDWDQLRVKTVIPLHQAAQHALELLQSLPNQQDGIAFQARMAASCVVANVQWLVDDLA